MKIRMTPGALLLFATLLLQNGSAALSLALAALFHECGHLLAARLLGIRVALLELDLAGARLYPRRAIPSYRAEGLLAAAGPAASLLTALFFPYHGSFFVALRVAALSQALFNLLPIEGFDGGRMLFALLARFSDAERAERVLDASTYVCLLFLFALSSCLLLRFGTNLSLAVLSASIFARQFIARQKTRI